VRAVPDALAAKALGHGRSALPVALAICLSAVAWLVTEPPAVPPGPASSPPRSRCREPHPS
jgi:hypothetical protein